MSLQEAAEQARQATQQTMRQQAIDRSEASLDKVIEKWNDRYSGFGRLAEDGFAIPEIPAREAFERLPYEKGILRFGSHRGERVYGWRIEVEGVPFLFSEDTHYGSLWLIHECPQCGCTGASSFYGLSDLGARLANGPQGGHNCMEAESREVAYSIGKAMRETGLSSDEIVRKAHDLHGDLIFRTALR